jgi:hypothetical protein
MGDFYGFRRRRWDQPASQLPPDAAARLRLRAAILNSNWLSLAALVVAATLGYLVFAGYLNIGLTGSATSGRVEAARLLK